MIVGRLDADYIGTDNCLSACHEHDQRRRDFDLSTMGAQLSRESGLPLVNCESCHGPGSLAVEQLTPAEAGGRRQGRQEDDLRLQDAGRHQEPARPGTVAHLPQVPLGQRHVQPAQLEREHAQRRRRILLRLPPDPRQPQPEGEAQGHGGHVRTVPPGRAGRLHPAEPPPGAGKEGVLHRLPRPARRHRREEPAQGYREGDLHAVPRREGRPLCVRARGRDRGLPDLPHPARVGEQQPARTRASRSSACSAIRRTRSAARQRPSRSGHSIPGVPIVIPRSTVPTCPRRAARADSYDRGGS